MFPLWRTPELVRGVIVAAVNSRNPQGWDGEDEKAILDLIAQLSKEYAVDPSQLWIGGFSAGGFMAMVLEVRHHQQFAGAVILGSGDAYAQQYKDDYKAAARDGHFYLFVGEKDPNNPVMKQTDKNLESLGCKNRKFVEAAGIGHSYRPQDVQEIGKWLADSIQKVAVASEQGRRELKKRLEEADRAGSRQEFAKAQAGFEAVLESAGKESEWGKKATKALADLEKKAEELIRRVREETDPDRRGRLSEDLAKKLEGSPWAPRLAELKP
jgi:pimeloyl-ACP methyl ester carboxylesterase